MRLREFPLLTDENIDPEVVAYLRKSGFDVEDVRQHSMERLISSYYNEQQPTDE